MKTIIKSIFLLTTFLSFGFWILDFGFLSTAYAYSIFSSAGLGEPVYTSDARGRGMGGVFKFDDLKDLTFEFSTLTEAIDTDGKATNFDLTLPQFRFSLPLPKSTAINIGLNEVLNLNFDIQDKWQKCAGDSVQHRITGRGSASTGKVSICKTLSPVSIEVGGFMVFGSAFEEWITDFGTMSDARDTIIMKFNGLGGMGTALLDMGKLNLTANYFSASKLTTKTNLPQRVATSIIFTPTDKFRIGAGLTRWQWEKPFTPMQRISIGSEVEISKNMSQTTTLRAGFYTGNWYYEIYEFGKVQEKVGSVGIGVALKSMCKVDMAFEAGTRKNNALEEKIYRLCITLQGRETL